MKSAPACCLSWAEVQRLPSLDTQYLRVSSAFLNIFASGYGCALLIKKTLNSAHSENCVIEVPNLNLSAK